MIDAVMYGMMPSAKIVHLRQVAAGEQVEEAEHVPLRLLGEQSPAPRCSRPASGCGCRGGRRRAAPSVNSTRLRRSATAKMFLSASTMSVPRCESYSAPLRRSPRPCRRPPQSSRPPSAELVRLHGQRLGRSRRAQHLDAPCRSLHERRARAAARRDLAPASKRSRAVEVHDRVLVPEDVGEAALRQPAVERHLAAFEAALDLIARARLRALVAAAGGLAVARARAAADALLRRASRPWRA